LPYIENKEAILQALKEVKKWEDDQKDLWFWEKLGRLPFVLLDRLTPKLVQDKVGQVIDEIGGYIQTGGNFLVSEQGVLRTLEQKSAQYGAYGPVTFENAGNMPLAAMDQLAEELKSSRKKYATVQGATTGFGGVFTLAIDIPALLGLSLKVLQEIAVSYGFDPNDKAERIFIVKCLQFSSSDIVGKKAIIEELSDFDSEERQRQTISQLQGWKEAIIAYADNYGWKKLFQLIPVAGMVFGAFLNRSTVDDVAETGKMLYRKRRALRKLAELET